MRIVCFMPWTDKHLHWLVNTGQKIKTTDGKSVEIWEFNHKEDDEVLSAWATHFRNHYCLDSEIDFLRKGYGFSCSEFLNNIKFPDPSKKPGPSIRSGDFGEVLVADYLEFIMDYWVPRTRYGNKDVRNESTKGCDIIGFKIIDETKESPKDTLAIFEAKAQFSGKKSKPRLKDAIEGSSKDYIRKAESLNAIKQRLYEKEGEQVASKIERFQNLVDKPYKEVFGAVALFTSSVFDPEIIKQTDTRTHPNSDNLILIVIKGEEMMQLVHELYRRAADEACK